MPTPQTVINASKNKQGVVVLPSQREEKAKLREEAALRVLSRESYATQADKKLALVYFAKRSFTDNLEAVIQWGVELDAKTLANTWFSVRQVNESARRMLVKQNIEPVMIHYKRPGSEEQVSILDINMPGYKALTKILDNLCKRLPRDYESVTEKEKCDALIWVAQHGRIEILNFLLAQKSNSSMSIAPDLMHEEYGVTALMAACYADRHDMVLALLNAKNRHDKQLALDDIDGRTPAIFAAKYANQQIIKLLRNKGADFNSADITGRTAEHYLSARQAPRIGLFHNRLPASSPEANPSPSVRFNR